ncbi:MAG TPA: hypothetical protein VMA09_22075 [Candidatus Binataceae bacterium]|nr:hypothetical protein [Candidatus Binataceae bacterium]
MPIRTIREALRFIERHGIVLESARSKVPDLAREIAGEEIRGSWWSHPLANEIYLLLEKVRDSEDVLVCRLVDGKVTFVHRRLWPAIVCLADRFDPVRIAAIHEEHTTSGKHRAIAIDFPKWVPAETMKLAVNLTRESAESVLAGVLPAGKNGG